MSGKIVLYIFFILVDVVQGDDYFCPDDCFCRQMTFMSRDDVYVVTRYYRHMSRVPTLNNLSSVPFPIYLKLSYSNLTSLTRDDFPPGLGITYLSLGGNRGLVVEDDTFSNLGDSLIYLDMETTGMFFNTLLTFLRGLSKLEHLILSDNNKAEDQPVTHDVQISLFSDLGLSSLKILKMRNCGMRSIDASVLKDVETIEELDLAENNFHTIPAVIRTLPNLTRLDLSNSYFEVIQNRTFIHNKQLSALAMVYSKLEIIEAGAFEELEKSLSTLDMRNSCLTEVPTAALEKLTALKILKLDRNKITSISAGSFSGAYCLNELSLSQMDLPFHKDMFEGQGRCIEKLALKEMHLLHVPLRALTSLHKLHFLFLDDNQIRELAPFCLDGINAEVLVFTRNPLGTIQQNAFNGTVRPLRLRIDYTSLNNLDFVLDYTEGTFAMLEVTGLPIPCDCTTARVMKTMEKATLLGTCDNKDTGASIGLQTDTVYQYLSRRCPGVLTTSGTCAVYTREAEVIVVLCLALVLFM